jgi:hypothetical protein
MASEGNIAEQESSVLERLEVLSELMQDQSGYQSMISSPGRKSLVVEQKVVTEQYFQGSLDRSADDENDATWVSSAKGPMDPWPALVAELNSRCAFLERDRNELASITEQIIKMERESHKVEIEAVRATAKREANEKLHEVQQQANRQIRFMYQSLCVHCQRRVYTTL